MRDYINIINESMAPVMTDESLAQPEGLQQFKQFARNPKTWSHSIMSRAFVELQRDYGWSLMGKGGFGYVYQHSSRPTEVLKIFQDTAYEKWIAFAKAHPNNPYVPKFIRGIVTIKGDIKAIRLERLERIDTPQQYHIYKLFNFKKMEAINNGVIPKNKDLAEIIIWMKNHKLSGGNIDINSNNCMMRGDQLVVTDPVS